VPDLPGVATSRTPPFTLDMVIMETSLQPDSRPSTSAEQFAASLQTERDRAGEFLAAQQARLERAKAMLTEELSRLEEQAQSTATAPSGKGRAQGGALDWEAEKRRIFAALDSDFDENDSGQRAERLKIEDVLQTTEKVLVEKDREIQQLKQQLGESPGDRGTDAVEAAVVNEALDVDAAVRQERERLQQLQDQWREKLRQAEIELSVERATLARQRAELENQIRSTGREPPQAPAATGTGDDAAQPARGRWLAKLGLSEADRVGRQKR
jgi:hypothetical protein